MENQRPKTTFRNQEHRRFSNAKFKPVKFDYNELQSKYDVYSKVTPNTYEQNVDNLKAYHIKNNIKALQLPAVDYILRQIKNIPYDSGTNLRDFNIHPSTIQKYGAKFRNLVSDQQQMKDFIDWFRSKENQITKRNCGASQKFYLNQSLIASGFNQIITHIAHISKARSEILKVLWNKQNKEVQNIFNLMHKQSSDFQKKNLQNIKQVHVEYQQQLINLRNQNCLAQKKLQQAVILNESCLNSLRVMRKQLKKYEKIIKQLYQSNNVLKQQNYQLLQANIQLTIKQHNMPLQLASVLTYQTLQLAKMKNLNKKIKVKNLFTDIKNKAEAIVQKSDLIDLEQKKQKLIGFIKGRIKQNPHQKNFVMKGQFSDQDNQDIQLSQNIQSLLFNKGVQNQLRSKITKGQILFAEKAINTQPQQIKILDIQNIAVQTLPQVNSKQTVSNLLKNIINQEKEGKTLLEKKKTQQRHSLMLIQINRLMEFKKVDNHSRIKKISNANLGQNVMDIHEIKQRIISKSDIEEDQEPIQIVKHKSMEQTIQNQQLKLRQQNFIRKHHESLTVQKSVDFKNMISVFIKQILIDKQTPIAFIAPLTKQLPIDTQKQSQKIDEFDQKIADIKATVKKYMQSETMQKQHTNNPEKHLKRIITDTFKNLFISKRTNILKQMLCTAKNAFGNVTYQNRLIHLISMMIQNKQKSLLSAISILLAIPQFDGGYQKINFEDLNQFYCKIYFYLTIKTPVENQFNIWASYTNIHKVNSTNFMQILRNYFSESKCMYLKIKIRQLIGIQNQNYDDNVSYVQLNPLMMYFLEVYLLQKQNYYQSYHHIIQFVSEDNHIKLQTFILLLDLLCIKQQQQKILINKYFTQPQTKHCHKDIFYRICVKYQLPLFEFIKVLKLQQFKILQLCLQNQYNDLSDQEKWNKIKYNLENMLKLKNKFSIGFIQILEILERYVRNSFGLFNQAFLFFYRIVVHAACV